jgi:hypothetical protein
MLKQIAEITGLRYNEQDTIAMGLLNRIANYIPAGIKVEDTYFDRMVLQAEDRVNAEGNLCIVNLVKTITAEPVAKVLKIKSSPKGARIKVAAVNGVRFSFGPIWNTSVIKGKGIALVEANRVKLNHQAEMLGISAPEKMEAVALAAVMAPMVA